MVLRFHEASTEKLRLQYKTRLKQECDSRKATYNELYIKL